MLAETVGVALLPNEFHPRSRSGECGNRFALEEAEDTNDDGCVQLTSGRKQRRQVFLCQDLACPGPGLEQTTGGRGGRHARGR